MKRSGFTMVELLVVTALAATLMLTVLRSVTVVTQSAIQGTATTDTYTWHHRLFDLLQQDLAHARRLRMRNNRLEIESYHRIDGKTTTAVHRPVIVTYRVIDTDERAALVRLQAIPDQLDNQNHSSTLVLMLDQFVNISVTLPLPLDSESEEPEPLGADSGWVAPPGRLRWQLLPEQDETAVLIDHWIAIE